jgi:hypothetical protein
MKVAGKNVSAHGLIDGTKDKPLRVDRGAVQIDGTTLEFNIDPAADCQQFITNIDTVLNIMQEMIGKDKEMCFDPVAHYGFDYLASLPESATELGCSPDFNAWDVRVNQKPDAAIPFRTAAGHIHFGWLPDLDGEPENQMYHQYVAEVVREMDFYLGLPSLLLDTHPDSAQRRALYGKAGCYRPKKYGMEYRTLSNFWLATKKLKEWAYNAAQDGFARYEAGIRLADKYGDIQSIINTTDRKAAEKIIKAERLLLV